jgi:hypothetical protein
MRVEPFDKLRTALVEVRIGAEKWARFGAAPSAPAS